MELKKIGLLGGRGYAGQEIFKVLSQHDFLKITSVFSTSKSGHQVDQAMDQSLIYQDLATDKIKLSDEDAFILALPNNQSQPYIDLIHHHNSKAIIVDLSADNRFDDDWEYRVPEISKPKQSSRISNPGCYASAMQFMLAPLKNILDGPAHFFGISGYSGAGATPNNRNNLESLKDNILPYSLVSHLHEKEVQANCYPNVLFTPHVGNFFRGILMTGNFTLTSAISLEDITKIFNKYYENKALIFIQDNVPNMQTVQNTSKVIIGGFEFDEKINRLTFCCTLDNLLKGAATQAVQNLNSAFGWEDNFGII